MLYWGEIKYYILILESKYYLINGKKLEAKEFFLMVVFQYFAS